jgi:hypothetical protein
MVQANNAASGVPDIGRWRELAGDMGALENRYIDGFFECALEFAG